jgi:hypothetical protein
LTVHRAGLSHRRILLRLSCARARCSGTATLTVHRRGRIVTVEHASFALAARHRLTLKLNVTGPGARLLRAQRKLSAQLTVRTTGGHVVLRGAVVV